MVPGASTHEDDDRRFRRHERSRSAASRGNLVATQPGCVRGLTTACPRHEASCPKLSGDAVRARGRERP
ncbi:hypothetical protein BDV93DRAFT_44708 [Ceratobasidium sp. AG-I]|nr:hypothetical protein BDV93DRAFT_44708 [Ceratobasidium sp. AG-I]